MLLRIRSHDIFYFCKVKITAHAVLEPLSLEYASITKKKYILQHLHGFDKELSKLIPVEKEEIASEEKLLRYFPLHAIFLKIFIFQMHHDTEAEQLRRISEAAYNYLHVGASANIRLHYDQCQPDRSQEC